MRVEQLQKNLIHNKEAFVAMSFAADMVSVQEAIREGAKQAGYNAVFMKEIEHNHQIIPECYITLSNASLQLLILQMVIMAHIMKLGLRPAWGRKSFIYAKKSSLIKMHTLISNKTPPCYGRMNRI